MNSHESRFVTTLIAVCLTTVGCGRSASEGLVIYIGGDTAGWITPCGCAANQSGGLARRSTLVESTDPDLATLVLDAGGSASGTSDYHRLKLAAILRGLQAMGLMAHNIGDSEAQLGPATLHELSQQTGVRWLSTNLTSIDGTLDPQRLFMTERGGIQVAVMGVIDPNRVDHRGWQASEPLPSLLSALRNVEADVKIVLAYMPEPQLRKLAAALPEVDFVVGGPTGQAMSPVSVGSVTVLSATNKGKFLARLHLRPAESGQAVAESARLVEVASELAEDDGQRKNLKDYYQRLAEKDFPADETGLVSPLVGNRTGYAIAGSASCAACHPQADAVWQASRHRHAWEVLVEKGAQFDSFCQQCHTTGYGLPGGFTRVAESKALTGVGCENCHGPSEAHVADPRVKTPFLAKEQCLGCHDHENSPEFDHDAYWAKIAHGTEQDRSAASEIAESQPGEDE